MVFEIGDRPTVTDPPCSICGHLEEPDLLCIRIVGSTDQYNFVCSVCAEILAPELLPDLRRQINEIYATDPYLAKRLQELEDDETKLLIEAEKQAKRRYFGT